MCESGRTDVLRFKLLSGSYTALVRIDTRYAADIRLKPMSPPVRKLKESLSLNGVPDGWHAVCTTITSCFTGSSLSRRESVSATAQTQYAPSHRHRVEIMRLSSIS